jgi:hypothetical protein
MIGQSAEVFKSSPTVAEVAEWMGVSKPTATKYLKMMFDSNEIIMSKKYYRPNVDKFYISLHPDMMLEYRFGWYKADYQIYAQRVMKVVLQDA